MAEGAGNQTEDFIRITEILYIKFFLKTMKLLLFNLMLDLVGTEFQVNVWRALQDIPFAQTTSYLQIAKNIKSPDAVRAVGSACGKNRLWLVVPCHRVIGSDGKLTGYAGGLARKRWLLEHERGVIYGKQMLLF